MSSEETDARPQLGEVLAKKDFGEILKHLVGESGSLWRRLLQESGGGFFLKVGKAGLGVITSVVLARIMGADGYGAYVYVISWASILAVPAAMGLPPLLTREVARYNANGEWSALRGILSWSDRVILGASLSLMLISGCAIWYLGGGLESQLRRTLWIAAPLPVLLALIWVRKGALRGFGHIVKSYLPNLLVLPCCFLVLVGGIYFIWNLNPMTATGMRVLSAGIAVAVGIVLLRKNQPEQAKEADALYERSSWLRSAFPFLFLSGANRVNQKIPIIMLGSMVGAEAAGIYGVVARAAMLVTFIRTSLEMTLAPKVSEYYMNGDIKFLQEVIIRSAWLMIVLTTMLSVLYFSFGDLLLSVFGKEFKSGYIALCILLIGRIFDAGAGSVGTILSMTGNEIDTAKGLGIGIGVNVIAGVMLIPAWGVLGAALSAIISTILWNTVLGVLVYKKTGLYSSPLMELLTSKKV